MGQNDPTFEAIIKSISAIVFLSTPHRGTNLAEILNRILQVSLVGSPTHYISELASGSHALLKLNEQFRHAARGLDIVSLYETRPTLMISSVKMARIVSAGRGYSSSTQVEATDKMSIDGFGQRLVRDGIPWGGIKAP